MQHSCSIKFRKAILWMTSLSFLLLLFPQMSTATAHNFNDVQGKWYKHFVDELAEKNIINTERDQFNGENKADRAEVATLVIRAGLGDLNDYEIPTQTPLKDVDDWYRDAAVTAFKMGIMGYNEDQYGNLTYEFMPFNFMPREELAQVLFNIFSKEDRDNYQPDFENPYIDLKSDHWAYKAILWNWEKGYMQGYEEYVDGKKVFGMGDYVLRGQMAKVIALSDNELRIGLQGKLPGTGIVKKEEEIITALNQDEALNQNESQDDVVSLNSVESFQSICVKNCNPNQESQQGQQYTYEEFTITLNPDTPNDFTVSPGDKNVEVLKLDINSSKPLTAKATDIRLFIEDENGNVPQSDYNNPQSYKSIDALAEDEYNVSTDEHWHISAGDAVKLLRSEKYQYGKVISTDKDTTDGGAIVHSDRVFYPNNGSGVGPAGGPHGVQRINPYSFLENLRVEDTNGLIGYQAGPLAVENSNTPEPSGLLIVLDQNYDLDEDSELTIKLDISEHLPPGYRLRASVDYEDGYIEDKAGNPLSLGNGMSAFGSWLLIESESDVNSGEVRISLSSDSPEGRPIYPGEQDVELLKIDLDADSVFNLERIHLWYHHQDSKDNFSALYLYRDDQLISGPITISEPVASNLSTFVEFNINPPFPISSGVTSLTLKGDVSEDANLEEYSIFSLFKESQIDTSLTEIITELVPTDVFLKGIVSQKFIIGIENESVEIMNIGPQATSVSKGSTNVPFLNLDITPTYKTTVERTGLNFGFADSNGNIPHITSESHQIVNIIETGVSNQYNLTTNENAPSMFPADMIKIGDVYGRILENDGSTHVAGGLVVYSDNSLTGFEGQMISEVNPYSFLRNTLINNSPYAPTP